MSSNIYKLNTFVLALKLCYLVDPKSTYWKIKMETKSSRSDVIAFFKSKSKLAEALGVERSAVTQWIRRNSLPAIRAVQIEQLSCGYFKTLEVMAGWIE